MNEDIYLMTARKRNNLILRLDSFLTVAAASHDTSVLAIEHVFLKPYPKELNGQEIGQM